MRALIAIVLSSLTLLAMSSCSTGKRQISAQAQTPPTNTTTPNQPAFDLFFSELHSGMTRDDFDRVVRDHQFKDGLIFLPVIVSISDPNANLHIPPHGVYSFYFDTERRLVAWKRWADTGTNGFGYTNGGLRATFSTTTNK